MISRTSVKNPFGHPSTTALAKPWTLAFVIIRFPIPVTSNPSSNMFTKNAAGCHFVQNLQVIIDMGPVSQVKTRRRIAVAASQTIFLLNFSLMS